MAHHTLGELRAQFTVASFDTTVGARHTLAELRAQLATPAPPPTPRTFYTSPVARRLQVARRLLEAAERGWVVPWGTARDPHWRRAVAMFILLPDAPGEA